MHIHLLLGSIVINIRVDMKTQGSETRSHIGIHASSSLERNSILFLHGLILCSQLKRDGTCSVKYIFAFPKNERSKQDKGRSNETFPE